MTLIIGGGNQTEKHIVKPLLNYLQLVLNRPENAFNFILLGLCKCSFWLVNQVMQLFIDARQVKSNLRNTQTIGIN
jgi:hypothetical protein